MPKRARHVTVRGLAIVIASLLLLGAAGLAGSRLRSPGVVAAVRIRPDQVTAFARYQRLVSKLTMPGVIDRGGRTPVHIGTLSVANGSPMVTKPGPPHGATVDNGTVIAEVAGEPIYLLKGAVPMYRTLSVGTRGADVGQLQSDLRALGLYSGEVSAVYDLSTAGGVARLFAAHGYVAPETALAGSQARGKPRTPRAPMLPQTEAVFEPLLPATVLQDHETVGLPVPVNALALASGPVDVQATLTSAQAAAVSVGLRASFRVDSGRWQPGRVEAVHGIHATIRARRPLAARLLGEPVTVSVIFQDSRHRVLSVPVTALQTAGDGSQYVILVARNRRRRVTVRPGITIGGNVVVATQHDVLQAGDRIVVGQ